MLETPTLSYSPVPAGTRSKGLTLCRVRSRDAFERLAPAWQSLQARCPDATVFDTWQWNAPAARILAPGGVDAFVLKRGGEVVSIAPLARRGHLGLKALTLIGAGPADYSMADYGDFLIKPGYELDAMTSVTGALADDPWWDEVWLHEVPEGSPTARLLPELARSRGWYVDVRDASETYTVDLPATANEYLSRLSQNTRKALRRRWNKLQREHAGTYRTVAAGEDPTPALETLFDLHTRRWQQEGQAGIFKDEATRAFHREAAKGLLAAGMLDLTLLEAEGQPVAAQYCLDFNGRRLFYINGHEPGEEWQVFGLGFITDVARVEAAIGAGMTVADFGRSEGEYKARYMPVRRQNLHVRIFRSRAAYLRCGAYLALRGAAKPVGKKLLSMVRRHRAGRSGGAEADV